MGRYSFDDAKRQVIHDVNTRGWLVVTMLPAVPHPGWAFSVGLYQSFRHPEVVTFGLGRAKMVQIVELIGQAVRAGRPFDAELNTGNLLDEYVCVLRPVERTWYARVLGFATWFYGGDDFPALQVIWPDKWRRYPWHTQFDSDLLGQQPLLFHRDVVQARAQSIVQLPPCEVGKPGVSQ